jgi:hypothetical protein
MGASGNFIHGPTYVTISARDLGHIGSPFASRRVYVELPDGLEGRARG